MFIMFKKPKLKTVIFLAIMAPIMVQILEERYNLDYRKHKPTIYKIDDSTTALIHEALDADSTYPLRALLQDSQDTLSVTKNDCRFETAGSYGPKYKPLAFILCKIDGREKQFSATFRQYPDYQKVTFNLFIEIPEPRYKLPLGKRILYSFGIFVLLTLLSFVQTKRRFRNPLDTRSAMDKEIWETEEFDRILAEGKAKRKKD